MDLFTRIEAVIALAEGVRNPADVPAAEITARREQTAIAAVSLGVPPERAAEIAEEVDRSLAEFADALVAAGRAAEKVNAVAERHAEELRNHVQAD
jgi:hypothetical protein